VRLSIALLLLSLTGVLGGAWLIGLPVFGGAVIFDSIAVGVWALMRDDGHPPVPQQIEGPKTVEQVLDRFRGAA
jgi:hypothetical protein